MSEYPEFATIAALALRFALGSVFLVSFVSKLPRPRSFAESVARYEILPSAAVIPFAAGVMSLEALLSLSLLTGWLSEVALPTAAALLIVFLGAVIVNLRRGRSIPCGCFGTASEPISRRSATWLLILIGAAGVAWALRLEPDLLQATGLIAYQAPAEHLVQAAALAATFILYALWALRIPDLIVLARSLTGMSEPTSRVQER